jgi:hypothetical protein
MNWFKSVWMRLRKSNGLPGNEVLVPMTPPSVDIKPKRKYTRKTKDVNNS